MKLPKVKCTSCSLPEWINPEFAAAEIDFAIKSKAMHLQITEEYVTGKWKMKNIVAGIRDAIEAIFLKEEPLESADFLALGDATSLCLKLVHAAIIKGKPEDADLAWKQVTRILLRIKAGIDDKRGCQK